MSDGSGSVFATLGKALLGCAVAAFAVSWLGDALPPPTDSDSGMPGRADAGRRPSQGTDAADEAVADGGSRTITLRADRRGHFWIDGSVDGAAVRFMVDTGASGIALGRDSARAAGMRLVAADYTARSSTANGVARAAPVTIRRLEVGPIRLRNMPAHVMEAPMPGMALLGMSFLGRLDGYEVRGDRMVLHW